MSGATGPSRHERFSFRDAAEVRAKAASLGLDLPWSDFPAPLLEPLDLGGRRLAHRLVAQPMEGADAEPDGSPGSLTFRRYERVAAGGYSLIWFEAAAVSPEGRSNPRQLHLHPGSLPGFQRLAESARRSAARAGHPDPVLILQLTHSGRFSRPEATPAPVIARHDPVLDGLRGIPAGGPVISAEALDRRRDAFVRAASLAVRAGFDGLDIKACHGYLLAELLAAKDRTSSRYGGPLENRARLLLEAGAAVRSLFPATLLASRLGLYDGLPGGFGVAAGEPWDCDPEEPSRLAGWMAAAGFSLINVTAGIPAWQAHLGRPFDRPAEGAAASPEHPLEGVGRLIRLAAGLRAAQPGLTVVGTGFSWLRSFFPHVAAGALADGSASLIGLGRMIFAYPDAAADIVRGRPLDGRRICTACSICSALLRSGGPAGCAVRDAAIYGAPPREAPDRRPS